VQLLEGDSGDTAITARQITFYQPKRPPIPEDAVVLADYMLYADWVPIGDAETGYISKGARRTHASRDIFVNRDSGSNSPSLSQQTSDDNGSANFGFRMSPGSGSPCSIDLPVFSTNFAVYAENPSVSGHAMSFGGTSSTITKLDNSANDDLDAFVGPTTSTDLGVNKLEYTAMGDYHFSGFDSAGIIHTPHHYQTFETPFLHELVGGDRNMEQTNLICSPDGKTWDEITRDTSYITLHTGMHCGGTPAGSAPVVNGNELLFKHFEIYRGSTTGVEGLQKNFALACDRIICLEDGYYICSWGARAQSGLEFQLYLFKNSTSASFFTSIDSNNHGGDRTGTFRTVSFRLKRGDYLVIKTGNGLTSDTSGHYTSFHIKKA